MITHTLDVDPLLGQYDPGAILVGPLLSLSMSSSYRYFYIAGNGGKVYETISLGFVEVETDAQTQRADFIEKLKSRFAEVLTFGSHLELGHAVHMRWPNEETAKFLALAELEAKPKRSKMAGQQEGVDDDASFTGVVPDDHGKQLVDEVALEPADRAKRTDGNLTHVPSRARNQGQPMPVLRPAQTLVPSSVPAAAALSQPLRRDRAATEPQRHTRLSEDDIASAILRLRSLAEREDVPRLPVDRSLASTMLRFCAVGCSLALVAAVVAWVIVRAGTRQVLVETAPAPFPAPAISVSGNDDSSRAGAAVPLSDRNDVTEVPAPVSAPAISVSRNDDSVRAGVAEPLSERNGVTEVAAPVAAPAISVSRNDDSVPAGVAEPSSDPNNVMEVKEPALQAEAPPATVSPSPPSQPSQVASVQAPAAPVSGPQSPPVQGGSAVRQLDTREIGTLFNRGRHLDAEEIATLANRGADSLKSGDIASARLLLRRAAEAGSASAALMLGTTFDPLVIKHLGAIGVVPDVAQARQWYEKALELGSEAASQRLATLAHTGQ
jgi:hypothetical protein